MKINLLKELTESIENTNNQELINLFNRFLKENNVKIAKSRQRLYDKYIISSKWRNKREELFKIRGKICELCKSTSNIHVHHKTYKNLFNENMEDLQVLCKCCHSKVHLNKNYKGKVKQ